MQAKEKYRKEYINRINRVIDYIEKNLDGDLSLESLSREALFSPFHFHRIFSAFTGETLTQYIKRIRVEKACRLLLNNPEMTVGEVSDLCGYSSMPVFCRVFKERFDTSAQEFREKMQKSKIDQINSKNYKLDDTSTDYFSTIVEPKNWRYIMDNIQIKEMPAMDLIYCRHVGAFDQIGNAYEKLMKWAGPRGLLHFPETKTLTVYHDDPSVTEIDKVRQSACITVNGEVKPEGEFGKMNIPCGKHAVGRFEIDPVGFEQAWKSMCLWLSESGYQPADANPYELYHNDHTQHPEGKFILDICIPVKPL